MPTPTPLELSAFVKAKAASLGFALCGISGVLPRKPREFFDWWVDQGFGASMHYLRKQKNRRKHMRGLLPGANAVVMCAMRIPGSVAPPPPDDGRVYGKMARYSLFEDYHNRLLPLLTDLALTIDAAAGTERSLAYVDTGAISERSYAAEAGLGWIVKNSLLLNETEGSWFWLGEVITRAELAPDSPTADRCGTCRRCLDACPTGAILEDLRAVDARKCLSYWNIEHKGPIPEKLHAPMQDWLLGCDICQEVCPWNARRTRLGLPEPNVEYVAVDEILSLSPEAFTARFAGRAAERAELEGLRRNAEIVRKNALTP